MYLLTWFHDFCLFPVPEVLGRSYWDRMALSTCEDLRTLKSLAPLHVDQSNSLKKCSLCSFENKMRHADEQQHQQAWKNPLKMYPFLCEKPSTYSFLKSSQNFFQEAYMFCIKILECSKLCVLSLQPENHQIYSTTVSRENFSSFGKAFSSLALLEIVWLEQPWCSEWVQMKYI